MPMFMVPPPQTSDDILAHMPRMFFDLDDTIAGIVGPHCEVALHSLHNLDRSVVKVVNGHITGREVGAPITGLDLRRRRNFEESGSSVTPSYFSRNKNRELLKSTTASLADGQASP